MPDQLDQTPAEQLTDLAFRLGRDVPTWLGTSDLFEARERVIRGAKLLDDRFPNWPHMIQPGHLQMSDGCNCICGQLGKALMPAVYHGFSDAKQLLGLSPSTATDFADFYGFDCGLVEEDETTYEALWWAWLEAVDDRINP